MGSQQLRCLLQIQGQLCLPAEFQANSELYRGTLSQKSKSKTAGNSNKQSQNNLWWEKGKIFSFNQLQLRWPTFYILLSKPYKRNKTKWPCSILLRSLPEACKSRSNKFRPSFKSLLPTFRSAHQASLLEWSLCFRVSETTISSSHPIPPFLA